MRIAVLGPGGVGGFVAGALVRAGADVVVVARAPLDGISVESVRLGEFEVHPPVVTRLDEPVDALVVATKAPALDAAIERVRSQPRVVLPLLNGLDHLAVLRRRFGDRVVPAAIRIESERVAPGRIVQSSPFLSIEMAAPGAPELVAALDAAGIPVTFGCEPDVMWRKLVRLNALALTTSAYELPVGEIRTSHRETLAACIREAAAVARADRAGVDPDAVLAQLDDAHASLSSSMARDIAAGAEPELDAIAGAVLRAARRHGLQCPTIGRLAAQVAERARVAPP